MKPSELRRQLVERCASARTHHAVWDEGRGSNVLVRTAVNLDNLPDRFGIYLIEPGGSTTRAVVFDLDNHGDEPLDWDVVVEIARPITKHLRAIGHSPMVFRSRGGRGIHIWLVWDDEQSSAQARAMATSVVEACSHDVGDGGLEKSQIEIFPKQDEVPKDGVGNCIDLPLAPVGEGQPLDPKTLTALAEPPPIITSIPLDMSVVQVAAQDGGKAPSGWDVDVLESALACIPADDYGDWVNVLRAMKGAAARGQLKLTDSKARDIAEAWSRTSIKHTAREFDYKWSKGCRRDANGKGRSLGSLFWLARQNGWEPPDPPCCIERIRIQESSPKLYYITITGYEGVEIEMLFEEMNSKKKFQDRVGDGIDRMVEYPKRNDFNRLLECAERIAADDDATKLGQFKRRLERFLDETMADHRSELYFENKSWRDEKNARTWFKADDLIDWLQRARVYDYRSSASLFSMIRALGGGNGVINLGKSADGERRYGTKRCWWVPIDPRDDMVDIDPFSVPDEEEAPF